MTTNKYATLRGTIARAKRHDCQKVVMRVALAEEVLDQLSNAEKQIAALAAENAGLKDINAWCKTDAFKNMYREFKTAEAIGCHDVDCMHDAMLTAIMHAPKTTATDAFLAEVRAHDLNAFIQHHSAELDAHIKNGGEQFDEKSVRIRDIIVSARLFREQIRKGVQS